jgi:threonine dehydratase
MPKDAPALKIANTRAFGAEVLLYDREAGESREDLGQAIAAERGLTLIRPYDDPHVIAGQGTVGLEIAEQAAEDGIEKADVLVCCGGGGLTAGVALALEDRAPGLRTRPVEPVGFDDVARSLISGGIESNDRLSGSICDAILTPAPGNLTFPIMKRLCGPGLVIPEEDCRRAMVQAFARLKVVLEPGGAIALAAALYHPDLIEGDTVIAVASGGNVDAAVFTAAMDAYGSEI